MSLYDEAVTADDEKKVTVEGALQVQKWVDDNKLRFVKQTDDQRLVFHLCWPREWTNKVPYAEHHMVLFRVLGVDGTVPPMVHNAFVCKAIPRKKPGRVTELPLLMADYVAGRCLELGLAACTTCGKKKHLDADRPVNTDPDWTITLDPHGEWPAHDKHLYKNVVGTLCRLTTLFRLALSTMETIVASGRYSWLTLSLYDVRFSCKSCRQKNKKPRTVRCKACDKCGEWKRCGGCKTVFYCSDTCLAADRTAHRAACVALAATKALKQAAKTTAAATAGNPNCSTVASDSVDWVDSVD